MKKITLIIVTALSCFAAHAQNCAPNSASLNFNGTSSYVNVSNQNLNITDSVTVEAWIYPTQWGASEFSNSIFCKHAGGATPVGYVLRGGNNGQITFAIRGIDSTGADAGWLINTDTTSPGVALNAWHHVAGTFDGTVSKVYIDGVLKRTMPFTGTIKQTPVISPRIGAWADPTQGPARYFKGNIDEVRVWHRALSQTEITAQMNNHIDTATAIGLAGYWRFNENSGTTVNDISGHGNTGTLVSTAWATIIPFNPIPAIPIITWSGTNITVNTTLAVQWYFNFNPIPGATTTTITPTQNGTYTVVVTNAAGCTRMSPPFNLTSAGIVDLTSGQNFILYPSPASMGELITLQLAKPEKNLLLKVIDVTGEIIMEVKSNGQLSDKITFDSSRLTKGIYFFHLQSEDINTAGKLVIN
ncbi:MAG: LamG-like jellyroll fold domain-containing protein [Bacteroidia bacterium]